MAVIWTVKKLQKKVVLLENELCSLKENLECNDQYNRRNNIEISGIPTEVADDVLEEKIIEIRRKTDVEISANDIEACHRLPSKKGNKKVIVKFVNRKKTEKCLK